MCYSIFLLYISIGTLKQNIVYDPKWAYSFATSVGVDTQYSLMEQDIYNRIDAWYIKITNELFTIIFLLESRKLKLINIGEGIIQKCNYKNGFIWCNIIMFVNTTQYVVCNDIYILCTNEHFYHFITFILIDNICRKTKDRANY